jgi:hypothetical protein
MRRQEKPTFYSKEPSSKPYSSTASTLLASLLEQQTILAKQQREATTNTINADIERQASMAGNMAQMTGTLTNSLQNFRMP